MHENLQEKYISSVFQLLKMCKTFRNFDFNYEKIHWVLQLPGNKVIEKFSTTSHAEHPNSFIQERANKRK